MKKSLAFRFGSASVAVLLLAVGARVMFSAVPDQAPSTAAGAPRSPGRTIVVNSTADSGPGTLRQALLDAQSGDTITFDAAVFPPVAPVIIALTSGLPELNQGNLTIDASNAGVILDGSNIGTTPETLLLDDVSLTLDGGPNLIANGDFSAGVGHWRPWDENPGAVRSLNSGDFTSAPNSYGWASVAHVGDGSTIYDTLGLSQPFDLWPFRVGSSTWISVTSESAVEMRFWYRYGPVTARLHALFSDGHEDTIGDWSFDRKSDWTATVATWALPEEATHIALEFRYVHSEYYTRGLSIDSDDNTVRGLQIARFPGPGISLGLHSPVQNNVIGGERQIGVGPLGQGNLVSSNGNVGIGLWQASFNTISGNYIGTDKDGTSAWGNRFSGIFVTGGVPIPEQARKNVIGPDNLIAYNGAEGIGVWTRNALYNTITQNSIYDNGWTGIELAEGGNAELVAPFVLGYDLSVGAVEGWSCANCTVEVFSDTDDEGAIFEGSTASNGVGYFAFSRGIAFTGPHLTATATDANGNTSEFSVPTVGTKSSTLQLGNLLAKSRLQSKRSVELSDNYIGRHWHGLGLAPDLWEMLNDTLDMGLKRFRLSINSIDSDKIVWGLSESSVDPIYDEFISRLADNGITITYVLSFWDKAYVAAGGEINTPRFKTEEEIQRYLDFVRFIVRHFRDRVQYYEIWNEPNISSMELQWIEIQDYINLVKRAVPVIRQEYPAARIVVGSTSELRDPGSRDYLFSILNSDVMTLVDAVSWHPYYGESPAYDDLRSYYYEYPSIVEEIKSVASANGFEGEYIGDEVAWRTHDDPDPDHPWTYSKSVAAKYYTRGIMTHLGMEVRVSQHAIDREGTIIRPAVQNLCTVMAGAESQALPFSFQSTTTNTVSYTFSLPSGGHLIALWTDGVAVDDDPGVPSTLTAPGLTEHTVFGMDVLHGFQQQLVTSEEDGNLVIRDLLIKDYPLILWLFEPKYVFLPSILKDAVVGDVDK